MKAALVDAMPCKAWKCSIVGEVIAATLQRRD
jgi:hypothetical protein